MGNHHTSNKSLLLEIHRSKLSYSYSELDSSITFDGFKMDGPPIEEDFELLADSLKRPIRDLIIREQTDSHVPEDAPIFKVITKRPQRDPKPTNFPPFREYKWIGALHEVRRSHWKGDLETGAFSAVHGRCTDTLLQQCYLMTSKIAQKSNWRGYSYVEDMQSEAMERLFQRVLKFNEIKSSNPFAYISQIVTGAFTDVLNQEKRQSDTKKDLFNEYIPFSRMDHRVVNHSE